MGLVYLPTEILPGESFTSEEEKVKAFSYTLESLQAINQQPDDRLFGWVTHPTNGKCLLEIEEDFYVYVKIPTSPTHFDSFLDPYITAGAITASDKLQVQDSIIASRGNYVFVEDFFPQFFKNLILTKTQARALGYRIW